MTFNLDLTLIFKVSHQPLCIHGNSVLVKSCGEDGNQQDSKGGTVWRELKESSRV